MFSWFRRAARLPPSAAYAIRTLRMGHAAICARLHAAAFAHAWSAADLEVMLANPANVADGAFGGRGGALAGFIISSLAADEAEVLTITMDAARRRLGIGRKLLLANMGRLAGSGAKKLFLEVEDQNAGALALYASLGFAEVGRRKAYYGKSDGSRGNALILRRDFG